MSYDPRCEELARYFTEDNPATTEAQVKHLSQGIQDYIEDWMHSQDIEGEYQP